MVVMTGGYYMVKISKKVEMSLNGNKKLKPKV